jgi:apolipoprotein N-acyltransferase
MANKKKFGLPAISGLLLTAAFPKIGLDWMAWFAIVPLLYVMRGQSVRGGFCSGYVTGLIHFLTLLYWLVPVMRTYGYLPMYLSIIILFLFAAFLALFIASVTTILAFAGRRPVVLLVVTPPVWVALEYIRSFIFSGFPWELLGYSQYERLHLIQISDIFGVYGLSALIALVNGAVFMVLLFLLKKKWRQTVITGRFAAGSALVLILSVSLTWIYGLWRLETIDHLAAAAPKSCVSVIQGNIDQAVKWDPAFQTKTVEKYNYLSSLAAKESPDLIVWPESATPFYFMYDVAPSELVFEGIRQTGTAYLIGSPSFVRRSDVVEYYNSAYLIEPEDKTMGKYSKTHLVPFGEYVPFKKYLPFLGKIVAQVGDFRAGKIGNTIPWRNQHLGIQICYEIIFPRLSRAMAKNNATVLINITNDAWFGKTSGPYQHFSMTVFRAVENRRSLVRAANTGISGFIDPAGRILASTGLLQDAVATRLVPLLKAKSIYTRVGDAFAQICLTITLTIAPVAFYSGKAKKEVV